MDNPDIAVDSLLDSMSKEIDTLLAATANTGAVLVGIHTGGVWVAAQIRQRLSHSLPLGELNIAFYRDDFSRIGMHPHVAPSSLPFDIENKHVILIDDVLYTGRTIRAAMNELFDYGRPARITLAVLIDRNEHELPIRADVVGKTLALDAGVHVKLSGPEPLALVVKASG